MRITGLIFGVIAGVFSIVMWTVFTFYNPYAVSGTMDAALSTFIMICLPACLAIAASCKNKKILMFAAFIWSLPFSLYLMLTPGIFAWFMAPCVTYLICYLLMRNSGKGKITFSMK